MSGFQGKYLARGTCLGVVSTSLVYQAIIMDKVCKDGDGTNDRVLWQSNMSTSETGNKTERDESLDYNRTN